MNRILEIIKGSDFLQILIITTLVCSALRFIVYRPVIPHMIMDNSMEPTLKKYSIVVLIERKRVQKNQLVFFKEPSHWESGDKKVIKRVAGVSGEKIKFTNTDIRIEDKVIENFSSYYYNNNPIEITIPPGKVFVVNDNKKSDLKDGISLLINGADPFIETNTIRYILGESYAEK